MWLTELYQGSSWGTVRASISRGYAALRPLLYYLQRECNVLETFEYGSDVTEMACMASWIKHVGGCSRRRWTCHIKAEHLTEQVSMSIRLWTWDPRYSVWLWTSGPRTERFCVFSLTFPDAFLDVTTNYDILICSSFVSIITCHSWLFSIQLLTL